MKNLIKVAAASVVGMVTALPTLAAEWSSTELQYQYGNIQKPFQGGGSEAETNGTSILTMQHASGWKYGDNFFFIDHLAYGQTDYEKATNQLKTTELYGEIYSNFSLSKITGNNVGVGFIKDVGIIAGLNMAAEVDTFYYLPGVRLALDIPGFAFANLDTTAYIQARDNKFGVSEEDSWMVDFNWALPFTLGSTKWSLEGHVEYIEGADTKNANGSPGFARESWILAQPQLRLDVGNFWGTPDVVFAGIEWQYWENKLGDKDTDENVVQALLVWRL